LKLNYKEKYVYAGLYLPASTLVIWKDNNMTVGILGKKVGMTQVYDKDGILHPVTVIETAPGKITQIKSEETDGYKSIQVGFDEVKARKLNKPELGHLAKSNSKPLRHLKEFRVEELESYKLGESIDVNIFKENDMVDVTGKSIGKGFMGTIARYNFARGRMTHGSKSHRLPGSIGAGTTPSRVVKGKKMAGRKGAKRITAKNLRVIKIDNERNLILVRGSVPGVEGGLLLIKPTVRVGKDV